MGLPGLAWRSRGCGRALFVDGEERVREVELASLCARAVAFVALLVGPLHITLCISLLLRSVLSLLGSLVASLVC